MIGNIYPFVRFSRVISVFPQKKCIPCEHRLFLCISGSGKINIDQTDFFVKKGTVIFVPSGITYFYIPNKNTPFSFIGFNFDFFNPNYEEPLPVPLLSPENFTPEAIRESDFKVPPFNKPFVIEDASFLNHLFYDINREFSQKKLFYEYLCTSKMIELIFNIIRIKSSLFTEYSKEKTDDILLYIQNNCSDELSNAKIADVFGYHANYINRLIRQNTGMSLHKYVIQCRLDKALRMLQDTDMSIGQISELAGFPDMTNFSKTFRQHIGISASDYRKGIKA